MVDTLKCPNWSRLVSRAVDVRRDASLLVIFLPPRVLMLISSQTLNSLKKIKQQKKTKAVHLGGTPVAG